MTLNENPQARKGFLRKVDTCIKQGKTVTQAIIICHQYLLKNYPSCLISSSWEGITAWIAAKYAVLNAANEIEYLRNYAAHKRNTSIELNDKGAFGDLFEVLLRLAATPRNFWKKGAHVARCNHVDITLKRGTIRVECGHNGKEFHDSTADSWQAGNFDRVAYAIVTDEQKAIIYELCEQERIEEAVAMVAQLAKVFTREEFNMAMDNRSGYWQVRLTSKTQATYDSNPLTWAEYLKNPQR